MKRIIKKKTIEFRIDERLKEKFEKLSAEKGMNVTEYLRFLIVKEVEREVERKDDNDFFKTC